MCSLKHKFIKNSWISFSVERRGLSWISSYKFYYKDVIFVSLIIFGHIMQIVWKNWKLCFFIKSSFIFIAELLTLFHDSHVQALHNFLWMQLLSLAIIWISSYMAIYGMYQSKMKQFWYHLCNASFQCIF